jgi:hypothetical protein
MNGWALLETMNCKICFLFSPFTFLFCFLAFLSFILLILIYYFFLPLTHFFPLYIVLACLALLHSRLPECRDRFPPSLTYSFCSPSFLPFNGIRSRVRVSWLVLNRSFGIVLHLPLLVSPKSWLLRRFPEFRFQIRTSATLTQISPSSLLPHHSHFNVRVEFSISLATKLPAQLRKLC